MDDHLQRRLEKIRSYGETAKRRASLYNEIAQFDGKKTAESLGAVQRASAPGKKLQKIGFIMLWVPEPTGVTCAIGAPMILAGRYMDKRFNGSTISDIGQHTKDTFSSISDFKKSVF